MLGEMLLCKCLKLGEGGGHMNKNGFARDAFSFLKQWTWIKIALAIPSFLPFPFCAKHH